MGSKRRQSRSDDEALRYLKRISEQPLPPAAFADGTVTTMSAGEMFEFLKGRIAARAEADTAARPPYERWLFSHTARLEGVYREAIVIGMVDPVLVADAEHIGDWDADRVELKAFPRAHVARTIGPEAARAVLPEGPRPGVFDVLAIVTLADGGEEFHSYTVDDLDAD